MVVFDWIEPHFLHVQYIGRMTGDQLIRSTLDMSGDERLDTTHYILGDWSHYERSYISEEDIKTLIAVMKSVCKICPHVKNATVIRPDRSGNALVAFYKMLADDLPWKIEIFHDFHAAFNWFELPIPDNLAQQEIIVESASVEASAAPLR